MDKKRINLGNYLKGYLITGLASLILLSSDAPDKRIDKVRIIHSYSSQLRKPLRIENGNSYFTSDQEPDSTYRTMTFHRDYTAQPPQEPSNSYVYKPSKTTKN